MNNNSPTRSVLLITPRFYPFIGGQESQAELLARSMNESGIQVCVLTESSGLDFEPVDYGFCVSYLTKPKRIGFERTFFFIRSMNYLLRNRKKFDLILVRTFCIHSLAVGLLKRFGVIKAKSLIMTDSKTEVLEIHRFRFKKVFIWMFLGNDFINAISDEVNAQLDSIHICPERIKKIPNMIAVECGLSDVEVAGNVKRFIFVGNLTHDKGIYDLARAFAAIAKSHQDVELHIAGSGTDRTKLEEFFNDKMLEQQITFHGTLRQVELDALFNLGGCVVNPSHHEGFGLVPFEASLYPLHVIATNVGAVKKFLINRCIIIEPGNVAALTFEMKNLIESDRISHYTNEYWIKSVSPKNVVAQIMEIS
jgi:glycosyltransferase involved in cell wall biosynthesis